MSAPVSGPSQWRHVAPKERIGSGAGGERIVYRVKFLMPARDLSGGRHAAGRAGRCMNTTTRLNGTTIRWPMDMKTIWAMRASPGGEREHRPQFRKLGELASQRAAQQGFAELQLR